jgi:hypothetical protein
MNKASNVRTTGLFLATQNPPSHTNHRISSGAAIFPLSSLLSIAVCLRDLNAFFSTLLSPFKVLFRQRPKLKFTGLSPPLKMHRSYIKAPNKPPSIGATHPPQIHHEFHALKLEVG